MATRNTRNIWIGYLLILFLSYNQEIAAQKNEPEANALPDLEELISLEVVSASKNAEKLNEAPATVIVITQQDIAERGYFELFDVLNDLPGFDLSRAFGDDHHYAYVRGYRKTTSDQMLFMLDGIIMNHLYNNNMMMYGQYPLQNVRQIEVVYGPASAIYGPNAFTGVINIITKDKPDRTIQATTGQFNSNIVDLYFSERVEDFSFSLSTKLYQTDGPDLVDRTPMLRSELYTNPYYWGDFAMTNIFGYKSPIESYFFNPSINFKGLSLGLISFNYKTGLGAEFAGGTSLNAGFWENKENTIYGRYEFEEGKLSGRTLTKIRRSDIPGSSTFYWRSLSQGADTLSVSPGNSLDQFGLNIPNTTTEDQVYVVDVNTQYAEYWQANNASYSFFQDFTYTSDRNFQLNFGFKYELRRLNRDYIINSNQVAREYVHVLGDPDRTPLNPAVIGMIQFPERPDDSSLGQENHSSVTDRGIYGQLKYTLSPKLTLFTGLRYDYNSIWKEIISPRIGIVAEPIEGLTTRFFFGTAFLEPSARILYGGWQGSLSNDQLKPEKMRTYEASLTYSKSLFSIGINGFFNKAPQAIGQIPGSKVPINLGSRRMIGAELHGRILMRNGAALLRRFKGDVFISYIKSEEDLSDTGTFENTGNMAPIKVKTILTSQIGDHLSISLQSRYISEITTVRTNPLGSIDSHFVSDTFIQYNDILLNGFSLGLKIYNLFDSNYFHPGYRAADAGETSVNQALSSSTYNSRLPQPRRNFLVSFKYQF